MTPDELLSILRDTRPSWERDGLGVRGGPEAGPFAPEDSQVTLPAFSVGGETGTSGKLQAEPFTEEVVGGGGIFPRGCPFDLIPTIEAPPPTVSNPFPFSTKSSIVVAEHSANKLPYFLN